MAAGLVAPMNASANKHHEIAHALPSMHAVLLQDVCILLEEGISRCPASNTVLVLDCKMHTRALECICR